MFPAIQNQVFTGFADLDGNVLDMNRTFLTVSAAGSEMKSDRIEPDMYQIQSGYIQNISAIIYKKKAWIAVTFGSNQTTNNRVYQMDFSMSNIKKDQEVSWCPFIGINATQFCIYNGNLYFGSAAANGYVYQCETGQYTDDGAAINSYYYTKQYSAETGDPEGSDTYMVKDFRFVNLLVENTGNYNMNFTYRMDSDNGTGTAIPISVSPGGTNWGSTMIWGASLWNAGVAQTERRIFLANARGRRVQFKFDNQNTTGQRFKVHGLQFLYNLKGVR